MARRRGPLLTAVVALLALAGAFVGFLAVTAPASAPIFSTGNPASDGGAGAAFTGIMPTYYNFAYESWLPTNPNVNHTVSTIQMWMSRQAGAPAGYFALFIQGGGIDQSKCRNTDGKPGNGCYAVYASGYVAPANQSVLVSFDVSGLNWVRQASTQVTQIEAVAIGSNGDVGTTPTSGYGISLLWASASSQGSGHYATHAGSIYVLKVPPSFQYYDLAIGGVYETLVAPPAPLTADFTSSSSGLSVTFASTVAGGSSPYTYAWDFGDAGGCPFSCHPSHTSTAANPTFAYATAGTYTVNLTVGDAVGHTAPARHTVTVSSSGYTPMAVDFTFTVDADGVTARFTSSVWQGLPPYAYSWSFGDSSAKSTSQNPVHAYASSGTFTVTLSVTDTKPATVTASHTVQTNAPSPPPTATFSYTAAYLYVAFVGSASGGAPPYKYAWDFGDGGSSASASPSHGYIGPGSYAVVFTVTDSKSMTGSQSRSVSVSAPPPAPTPLKGADFTTQNVGNSTVSFTSTVNGGNGTITYRWDFGDSATSALGSPVHQFPGPGTYTVNLTVTDSSGMRKSASHAVTVTAAAAGAPVPWKQVLGIVLAAVGASIAALMLEYRKLRNIAFITASVVLVGLGALLLAGVF